MMTTQNDKLSKWLWGLNLSLLTFIAGGVGWLLVTMNDKVDDNKNDIIELKIITYNLAKATELNKDSDQEWRKDMTEWRKAIEQKLTKHDEQFMEVWKMQKRGGQTTDMTKYMKDEK